MKLVLGLLLAVALTGCGPIGAGGLVPYSHNYEVGETVCHKVDFFMHTACYSRCNDHKEYSVYDNLGIYTIENVSSCEGGA